MVARFLRAALLGLPLLLLLPGLWPSAPTRPPPSDRTVADLERLLENLIERHRVEVAKPFPCVISSRQEGLWELHLLGRLLARVYPEPMEVLLMSVARDVSRAPHARAYCITLLGHLSRAGRSHLEATFQELAYSGDRWVEETAIDTLSSTDLTGRYLDLYRSKCHAGLWAAFEAVARWDDPGIEGDLNAIQTLSRNPSSCEQAEEALRKIRLLRSKDCDRTLEGILLEGRSGLDDGFRWAVGVARRRALPFLLPALRRHLDHVEQPLPPDAGKDRPWEFEQYVQILRIKLTEGHSLGSYDLHYDEALLAYAELGGTLNEIERQRLTVYGVVGDPRKRLEELLMALR